MLWWRVSNDQVTATQKCPFPLLTEIYNFQKVWDQDHFLCLDECQNVFLQRCLNLQATFLQHCSSTFLCHINVIPDRSCLDVPVGRKWSACNGLAPELLHGLQYSLLPLSYWKTIKPWRTSCMSNTCMRIPSRYWFGWVEMGFYRENKIKDVMTSLRSNCPFITIQYYV